MAMVRNVDVMSDCESCRVQLGQGLTRAAAMVCYSDSCIVNKVHLCT